MSNIPLGLCLQKVAGDGHCLFRAVSYYLNHGEDPNWLRKIVASNMEENQEEFKEFIDLSKNESLDDYITKVRNGVEWADNIEIFVLMRVLNRPIVILGPTGKVLNREDIEPYLDNDPIFVYYNGFDHYDALLLQEKYHPRNILDSLL